MIWQDRSTQEQTLFGPVPNLQTRGFAHAVRCLPEPRQRRGLAQNTLGAPGVNSHVTRTDNERMDAETQTGFCVWLTGLSGAGKSTIAAHLSRRIEQRGRTITLLDGDVVRTNLSQGLGFSKSDRDINVRRIGYVASEIVRHGGVVLVAAISPYEVARCEARMRVTPERFLLAFVDTPLDVCEQRDVKALYAKARRGEILGMTGVDDPYEPPVAPDISLTTTHTGPDACAAQIERLLVDRRLLTPHRRVSRLRVA